MSEQCSTISESSDDEDIYDNKINRLTRKLKKQEDSDDDSENELEDLYNGKRRRIGPSGTYFVTQQSQPIANSKEQEPEPEHEHKQSIVTQQSQLISIRNSKEQEYQQSNDVICIDDDDHDDDDDDGGDDGIYLDAVDNSTGSPLDGTLDGTIGSQDELAYVDYDFTLKVYYGGRLLRAHIKYNTKLLVALQDIAEQTEKDPCSLVLKHNDQPVSTSDTPASLKLGVTDILSASEYISKSSCKSSKLPRHPDQIELTLQDGRTKNPVTYDFFKNRPFIELKKLYGEKVSTDLKGFRLEFDGEPLPDDKTPDDLEMEDGYLIDVCEN